MPEAAATAQLYYFYGGWQVIICLFSGIALLSIWSHITQKDEPGDRDLGLLWVAISIFMWAISGVIDLVDAQNIEKSGAPAETVQIIFDGSRSILSILNSAFLLLALPWFHYKPKWLQFLLQSQIWFFVVIIPWLFCIFSTVLMFARIIIPSSSPFIYLFDFLYAIFTLGFLGIILWESFARRGLRTLAYLSALCIICTLAAQVLKLFAGMELEFWRLLLNGIFKTVLILLFFALSLSWVEELSKIVPMPVSEVWLELWQKIGTDRKTVYLATLTIPNWMQNRTITFTEKNFQLLKKFAEKRQQESESDGGWLEIQPKSLKQDRYDIKDYNEINRILDAILNDLKGENNWLIVDRQALKKILFEYDSSKSRRIRLRILPSNTLIRVEK